MDLENLDQLARAQGPVFWIASAAMALGATLLVVALVQHLRRVHMTRLASRSGMRTTETPATAAPPAAPAGAEREAAAPARPLLAAAPKLEDAGDSSLALLLRRLQSTGDRLEELAGDLRGLDHLPAESVLKEDLQDVEYVFKASGP